MNFRQCASVASNPLLFWFILSTSVFGLACNQKTSDEAAAVGSADGVNAQASGPCQSYATKLCEKAGEESATCQSIKTATELMPPAACAAGLKDVDYSVKKIADMGKSCDQLVSKLCSAVGPKTETCAMVTEQTKKFDPERCEAMLKQTDQIIAELKKREAMNQPLSAELAKAIAADTAPALGPADAKVTVVEFSDFQCPYCSRAADVVHKIREKYGDKVRVVFRQFPLSFHKNAHDAAEAALAAHADGKFWEYHDKLFANQQALDRESLEKYAKEAGVNLQRFKAALDKDSYSDAVDADLKLGGKVAVQGTPTMFINGKRVDNPTDFAAVSKLIDGALKG